MKRTEAGRRGRPLGQPGGGAPVGGWFLPDLQWDATGGLFRRNWGELPVLLKPLWLLCESRKPNKRLSWVGPDHGSEDRAVSLDSMHYGNGSRRSG